MRAKHANLRNGIVDARVCFCKQRRVPHGEVRQGLDNGFATSFRRQFQEQEARNDRAMDRNARAQLIETIRENIRQVQEEARKADREMQSKANAF